MVFSYALRLVLSTPPPNPRMRKRSHQTLMDPITELFHGRILFWMQYDRLIIVRNLSLRLCIYSQHVAFLPYLFHKLLEIPLVTRRYRNIVGHLIKDIQLFDCDWINFVEYVEYGDVSSVTLNNINELINCYLKEGRFVMWEKVREICSLWSVNISRQALHIAPTRLKSNNTNSSCNNLYTIINLHPPSKSLRHKKS